MRKFIIDTDTGSDDAVALAMGLMDETIDLLGITTVSGNCELTQATKNALMVVQYSGKQVPVYKGCRLPLLRSERVDAVSVHGIDGMGDLDLIHPEQTHEKQHAVDFIIEMVAQYPDEVEIAIIGPATNIALAIMKEPDIMKRVKHFYIMGTSGFALGNASTMAEFNVYADAESYVPLLRSNVPKTIIGFDICLENAFKASDIKQLRKKSSLGKFLMDCNHTVLQYNLERSGEEVLDLPDAVALGVALWEEEIVLESKMVYAECCYKDDNTYGLVILNDPQDILAVNHKYPANNAEVITKINGDKLNKKIIALM
ncbi:nucleoside hydrolase [Candidatus Enterococcus murrayae]|uniref:Nucleoside hydrolase n=1 Tax=Candidatus Enterococcus murrayae TaxID=2815321 RepID=A0ABS3HI72_9ENTE|nr:nucleoside hydrolase [Enterococcus sp. MJM16]MBO0453160.1 nucleoside hydrolase [Enterococcus sp. MJM16]